MPFALYIRYKFNKIAELKLIVEPNSNVECLSLTLSLCLYVRVFIV